MQNKTSGFTLVEILIAIALVAVMGAIVIPGFLSYLEKGKVKAAHAQMKILKTAIEQYYADVGKLPDKLEEIVKGPENEELRARFTGDYIEGKKVPLDPWGQKYQYKETSDGEHPFELYSFGRKGKSTPKDQWISVWK